MALTLPLIIPALLWLLAEVLPADSFLLQNSLIGDVGAVLIMSLMIGGVPYSFFLILTAIIYWNKPGKKLLEYCYFSPPIFYLALMIFAVLFKLYEMLTNSLNIGFWAIQNLFGAAIFYGIYTLIVGYSYVGFALLILFFLKKFDIISSV